MKEESEKAGLKLNIQKTKIMASSPTTLWHIDGETVETVKEFIFLWFKITAHGDCINEIKRHLLLGRKAMTNLDSTLKSRDITLPTKACMVKAMIFPVLMYGCEGGTIKKAECWRIDAFELWCRRRLLRVPWTARRSNQSILKEISPEYSLEYSAEAEALIFWPPDAKTWLIGKDPESGKDRRREGGGMTEDEMVGWHHWLNGHVFEPALRVGDGQRSLACCNHEVAKSWTRPSNWTTAVCCEVSGFLRSPPLSFALLFLVSLLEVILVLNHLISSAFIIFHWIF